MMYISVLETILNMINSKKELCNSKSTSLGDVSYNEKVFSISTQKYLTFNSIHFGGEIFHKSFMIASDENDRKLFLLQTDNGPSSYEKEYIETLIRDNKMMSDVEFVLVHGRNPLNLDKDFINILLIASEEGLFDV